MVHPETRNRREDQQQILIIEFIEMLSEMFEQYVGEIAILDSIFAGRIEAVVRVPSTST